MLEDVFSCLIFIYIFYEKWEKRGKEKYGKKEMAKKSKSKNGKREYWSKNKPAAQAAGADPSRCNSTYRQNLPLH